MKAILSSVALIVGLSGIASAEVKPEGAVLLSQCGTLNRSVELCIANSVDSDNTYLVLTGFAYRNHPKKGEYFLAKVEKDFSRIGASEVTYTAMVTSQSGRYIVEKEYVLSVTQVVYPGAKPSAQLYINGEAHGPAMELQEIYHTQSVEE